MPSDAPRPISATLFVNVEHTPSPELARPATPKSPHTSHHRLPRPCLQILIEKGANVNAADEKNKLTPLIIATQKGWNAVVALLLENGADPTAAMKKGATSLHLAAARGDAQLVDMLLSKVRCASACTHGWTSSAEQYPCRMMRAV